MKVINLSSGSDGNLTYIETESTKVLVDVGLSCSNVFKRLELLKVSPEEIDAVIITHEHFDHTQGLDLFCSKYNIDAYAHHTVWEGLNKKLKKMQDKNKKLFEGDFFVKDLHICPFELCHDVPCFGFSFENNGKKVSILTDLGHTNDRILLSVQGSQIVYLESNYDKKMLGRNEKYPLSLKRRIAGRNGHLSNDDCADFIIQLVLKGTRQIVLSHLSKDNNTPALAFETACRRLLEVGIVEGVHVKIDVASTRPGVLFNLK